MPPKVSRTSTVRTIPQKKTTVSSSKSTSKSSSTTSSKSTVSRPTTSTVRSAPPKPAPAPAQKPKNVDKVDFGKPKTIVDAGVYHRPKPIAAATGRGDPEPPAPPKPSKAELERIERLKAIEEAKSSLPAAIQKVNKAYENLEEAIKEYDEAAETLRVHTKDAQENGFFSSNSSKLGALALIVGRIATRYTQFAEAGVPPLYAGGAAAVVGTIEGLLSDIMIYEIPDALQVENQIKDDAKNVDIANEKVIGAATLLTTAKMQLGYYIKEADGKNLDKLYGLELPTTRQEIRRLFGV